MPTKYEKHAAKLWNKLFASKPTQADIKMAAEILELCDKGIPGVVIKQS